MVASLLIIAFSVVLFIYWFRYSCILLLRNRAAAPGSVRTPQDPRFSFARVQEELKTEQPLDPLHRSLSRDYQVFMYLVEHASSLSLESFEDRLLVLDYRLMHCWYKLTKAVFPTQARRALAEMASVLEVLAQRIGEQAGICVEA